MGCGASAAAPAAYKVDERVASNEQQPEDDVPGPLVHRKLPSWVTGNAVDDNESESFKNRQSSRMSQRLSRQQNRDSALAVDVSQSTKDLFNAVLDGEHQKLTELLDSGVDVNTMDVLGNSPLILAAEGEAACVAVLIEHNANLEHTNKDGTTALMAAITYEDTSVVEMLMTAGAKATGEACKLSHAAGVPDIIKAVTGESFQERKIDRESYRQKRIDTDVRVKSVSANDVDSFTKGFVIANAE